MSVQARNTSIVAILCMALAAVYLATFWPGILSPDSLDQYTQAKLRIYNDWHPVLMSFLWSFLLSTEEPSAGYLIFQVGLLCSGFFLVGYGLARAGFSLPWLVVLLGLAPPIWIYAGVLWSDVLLASFFLCSVGALLNAKVSHDEGGREGVLVVWTAAAAIFAILGAIIRHNGFFALVPIAFFLPWRPNLALRVGSVVVCVAIALLSPIGLNKVLSAKERNTASVVFTYDLAGISHFTGKNVIPGTWTDSERESIVQDCYRPQGLNSYFWGACKFVWHGLVSQGIWGEKLRNEWLAQIIQHPVSYLRHRVGHFWTFLGSPWGYRIDSTAPNNFGIDFSPGALFSVMDSGASAFAHLGLLTPKYLLLWSIFLAGLVCVIDISQKEVWLASVGSGIAYTASYLIGGVASDFRFFYWPEMIIIIATCIVLVSLATSQARIRIPWAKAPGEF